MRKRQGEREEREEREKRRERATAPDEEEEEKTHSRSFPLFSTPQNKTAAGDYAGATLDEQGNVWLAGMWSGGVPSASCLAKFSAARCPSWGTLVHKIRGKTSGAAATAKASDRATSLLGASNGAVISAKGVAGASVPGARAGEWAAKAARAKRAMEEKEEKERTSESATATAAGPSASAAPPSASAPLVPSAVTFDPDDVPERVAGGRR